MKTVINLTRRNVNLFFKDKGLFFTSLITPLILLVLYSTFLAKVYHSSFMLSIPEGMLIDEKILDGFVGGQLMSSLLSVSCITVAFCSNMLMVQDKVNGAYDDISVTPVKHSRVAISYFSATFIVTFMINVIALIACLIYIASIGWYITSGDILLILLDILLMTIFGTAFSSVVGFFLTSQGQISAIGSIVSSCYGFICGAYMPISQFGEGLRNTLSFLPGTYGTSLFRNHSMRGALEAFKDAGLPETSIEELRNVTDCNIYFFGDKVNTGTMYVIIGATLALLIGAYVFMNMILGGKAKKK